MTSLRKCCSGHYYCPLTILSVRLKVTVEHGSRDKNHENGLAAASGCSSIVVLCASAAATAVGGANNVSICRLWLRQPETCMKMEEDEWLDENNKHTVKQLKGITYLALQIYLVRSYRPSRWSLDTGRQFPLHTPSPSLGPLPICTTSITYEVYRYLWNALWLNTHKKEHTLDECRSALLPAIAMAMSFGPLVLNSSTQCLRVLKELARVMSYTTIAAAAPR